jgi:hypothetical protein
LTIYKLEIAYKTKSKSASGSTTAVNIKIIIDDNPPINPDKSNIFVFIVYFDSLNCLYFGIPFSTFQKYIVFLIIKSNE